MNCFIFRINNEDNYVRAQLTEGKLRQGWGPRGLSLLCENEIKKDFETWKKDFMEVWGEPTTHLHSSLSNMLEIKKGDAILIPKFPDNDKFIVLKAKEEYKFDLLNVVGDFGHLIKVDYKNAKLYDYSSNDTSKFIKSKMQSYRSPVNYIRNSEVIENIHELMK